MNRDGAFVSPGAYHLNVDDGSIRQETAIVDGGAFHALVDKSNVVKKEGGRLVEQLVSHLRGGKGLASCDSLVLMRWAVSNGGRGGMERMMRDGESFLIISHSL